MSWTMDDGLNLVQYLIKCHSAAFVAKYADRPSYTAH